MREVKKRFEVVLGALAVMAALTAWLVHDTGPESTPGAVAAFEPPPQVVDTKQWERADWLFSVRAFPANSIPTAAHRRAVRQIRNAPRSARVTSRAGGWESLGPTPIDSDLDDIFVDKGEFSGRVAALAADPSKAKKHWLVGGAQGGIWETKNKGKKWFYRTADAPTQAIGAIAFAPSNPKIVYAGTGEGLFAGGVAAGVGVLMSKNGGRRWKAVSRSANLLEGLSFTELAVHPNDPDTVIGGTIRGIRRQAAALPVAGVMRSTNGGVDWTRTLDGQVTSLKARPDDFSTQYAAVGEIFGSGANGLYASQDGGQSWSRVAGPWDGNNPGRMELAIAPSDPDVMYVSVHQVGASNLMGLWKTDNAAARVGERIAPDWEEIKLKKYTIPFFNTERDDFCDPQCTYDHVLLVDAKDPDLLYAGGVWLWSYDGKKWSQILPGHVDQHALAWAGKSLLVGNDGGVFSARKPDKSWQAHNDGLTLTQFYHGALHPDDFGKALAGSQDNGTAVRERTARQGVRAAGDAWRKVAGGDGADTEIAGDNPDTHWAFAFQNGAIQRTTDGGQSRREMVGNLNTGDGPFIAVFARCPHDDDVFLAGTDRVWRIDDFFTTGNPKWDDQGMVFKDGKVTAIAFAPDDTSCRTYAVGTSDGELRVTSNGGNKWVDVDSGNRVPRRAITDLAFDPDDDQTLWTTLSGFDENTPGASGHVFRTDDAQSAGARWDNVTTPANIPHNAIVIQPGSSEAVWVGTDLGLWEQTGSANNPQWTHHGPREGMPMVAVFDLQASADGVVAFTYGRGAFALPQQARVGRLARR